MVIFHELKEGFICGSYDTSTAIGLSFKLRVLKLTKNFEIFSTHVFAVQICCKLEGFLQRSLGLHVHKLRSIVKLHLQIFWSIIYVFRSYICVIWIFIFDGNTAQ